VPVYLEAAELTGGLHRGVLSETGLVMRLCGGAG
jgi:hypothetical protein